MRCAICYRQARGFGYFNPRLKPGDPRRATERWHFCSMRCQDAFAHLMQKTEGRMINPSDMERAAMGSCLAPLGDFAVGIGLDRPLADYSRDEILQLIDVVITAYQEHMCVEHERFVQEERDFLEERLASQRRPGDSGRAG